MGVMGFDVWYLLTERGRLMVVLSRLRGLSSGSSFSWCDNRGFRLGFESLNEDNGDSCSSEGSIDVTFDADELRESVKVRAGGTGFLFGK